MICLLANFILVLGLLLNGVAARAGVLDGTFVWPEREGRAWTEAEIRAYVDEIRDRLGFNTLVIAAIQRATSCKRGAPATFTYYNGFPQNLRIFLDQAAAKGVSVYIGLISTQGECTGGTVKDSNGNILYTNKVFWPADPALYETALPEIAAAMDPLLVEINPYLKNSQGQYFNSLAGWYLPDEPGLLWWLPTTRALWLPNSPSIRYPLATYYANLRNIVRWHETNTYHVTNKPHVIAPFLRPTYGENPNVTVTPTALGAIARDFKGWTGVEVQAWQDGVGSIAMPLSYAGRRPYILEDHFRALADPYIGIGSNSLWADVEMFSCCTTDASNQQALNFNSSMFPSGLIRVNMQLWQTHSIYAAKRVVWAADQHMTAMATPDSAARTKNGALRMFDAFRALYGIGGSYVRPASYTYITLPSTNYADTGGELSNQVPANATLFVDPQWTGINGSASVVLDFGVARRFDWVAAHVLKDTVPSILVPASMFLYGSNVGPNGPWQQIGPSSGFSSPTLISQTLSQGDYIIANDYRLGATFRYVRVDLTNNGWTFLDEIEVVSSQ